VGFLVARADYTRETRPDELPVIAEDYRNAVRLDPNNVDNRLKLARILAKMGDRIRADAELKAALNANDGLEPKDPKRLKGEDIRRILDEIESNGVR
jgi:hypothetical protein